MKRTAQIHDQTQDIAQNTNKMHSMSNDSIEEIEEESTLFSTFNNDPIAIQD